MQIQATPRHRPFQSSALKKNTQADLFPVNAIKAFGACFRRLKIKVNEHSGQGDSESEVPQRSIHCMHAKRFPAVWKERTSQKRGKETHTNCLQHNDGEKVNPTQLIVDYGWMQAGP